MAVRIVMLTVGDHPPLQISVDNTERYARLREHLTNYREQELADADPSLPVISVGEMEQKLGVELPEICPAAGYRQKLAAIFSAIRLDSGRHRAGN